MPKYGMVIDLQLCAGCGACALACKTENNTSDRADGQSFNWADYLIEAKGTFPNMDYSCKPVLCNHCTDAACVEACPVDPKAMYKTADGLTMHNNERCIGCRMCQDACPYSSQDPEKDGEQYSVISFNENTPHAMYSNKKELIKGGTASGVAVAAAYGAMPPSKTEYNHPDTKSVRKSGIVEKCTFCAHRTSQGMQPYCVEACPSSARIFGDLSDSNSAIAKTLKKHKPSVLKPEAKTSPNVYYVRNFRG